MNIHLVLLQITQQALYLISERQICREKLGEMLAERVFHITDIMNRHDYVPKMPNQTELDLVFDTSFPDVQPYLFRVGCFYRKKHVCETQILPAA